MGSIESYRFDGLGHSALSWATERSEDDELAALREQAPGPSTSARHASYLSALDPTKDPDLLLLALFLAQKRVKIIPFEELDWQGLDAEQGDGAMLGRGASMQVVLGRWADQEVALKIFSLDLQRQSASTAILGKLPGAIRIRYNKLMSDIFLELQVMAHHPLCDHPNIVKLLGISFVPASQLWKARLPAQSSGTTAWSEMIIPILVVEPAHSEHPDLRRYFQHAKDMNRKIPLATKLDLIADIADGMAALHSYSIIHSDLKPENILIFPAEDGRISAKICDFGFSGIAQSDEPPRGMSDGWEAPERLPGAERAVFEQYRLSTAQDVYAFGLVTAFILLDGNYPFEETDGWVDDLKLTGRAGEVVLNRLKTGLGGGRSMLRPIHEVTTNCLMLDPKERLVDLGEVRKRVTNKEQVNLKVIYGQVTMIPFADSRARALSELHHRLVDIYLLYHMGQRVPQFVTDQIIRQIEKNLPQRSWTTFSSEDIELLWRPLAGSILLANNYELTQSRRLTSWWISRVGGLDCTWKVSRIMSQDASTKYEDGYRAENHSVMSTLAEIPSINSLTTDKRQLLHDTNNLANLATYLRQHPFPILHILAKESPSNQAPIIDALGKAGAVDMDEPFGAPGLSPLHVAARFGNKKVAASLLLRGAGINKTTGNFWKWTALHFAVVYENWEMLEYLLSWSCRLRSTCHICNSQNSCKVNIWARDGRLSRQTVAHIAASKSIKALKPLLRHNRFLAHARDSRGSTPLHEAASGPRLDCVKALVAAGADPNAEDVLLDTPLHSVYKLFSRPEQGLLYCQPDKKEQEEALKPLRDLQNQEKLVCLIAIGKSKSALASLQALDNDSTVRDARQIIRFLVDHSASRRCVDALGCTPEVYSYAGWDNVCELSQTDMLGVGYCSTPTGNSWAAEDSNFGPQGCWQRIGIPLPETGVTAPSDTLENTLCLRNELFLLKQINCGTPPKTNSILVLRPTIGHFKIEKRLRGVRPRSLISGYTLYCRIARICSNYSEFGLDLEIKMIPPNEDENRERVLVSRRLNTAELCPNIDTAYLVRLGRVDMMHRSDLVISLCTPKEPGDRIRGGLVFDWFGLFLAEKGSENSLISEEVDISPLITTDLRNCINCPPRRGPSMPLPLQDTSAIDYGMTSEELANEFVKETQKAITRLQEEEDLWSGAREQRLRTQVARAEKQVYRLRRINYWFRRFRMPMIMIVVVTSIISNASIIISAHREASHP